MTVLRLYIIMLIISLGNGKTERLSLDSHNPKCLICAQSKKITFKGSLTFRPRTLDLPNNIFVETFEKTSIYDTVGFWEEYCIIFLHNCFKRHFSDADCDCRCVAPFRVQIKFDMLNLETLTTKSLRLRWTKEKYMIDVKNFLISNTYNLSVVLNG